MVGFITLEDAKAHLRLDTSDEDALVQRLIDAASAKIETATGYVAVAREQTFAFDRFERQLELRLRPIDDETIEVTYLDGNGDPQTFTDIRAIEKHGTTRILPAIGHAWPGAACAAGAVTVTATVGLGETAEAISAATPEAIKHAARLCVGHWFANREAVNIGNISTELPLSFADLVEDDRLRRV